MQTWAVVIDQPEHLALRQVGLREPGAGDVVVQIESSGISTGTERLFWTGRMPPFPGMGYPLVPGYESVGRVIAAGPEAGLLPGERVFVPGSNGFDGVRGLFGGNASSVVVPAARVFALDHPRIDGRVLEAEGPSNEEAVLLALAATAYHAVSGGGHGAPHHPPDLIVGHGVLGRLLARLTVAAAPEGAPPLTVWETNPVRAEGACGYTVVRPEGDPRRDYRAIYDVSGDAQLLDALVSRLAPGGEIVLAGFYSEPLSFQFAPAFMREARLRCAAEWHRLDMLAVQQLLADGRLSLDGLVTHRATASQAQDAYRTAFGDAHCLKMILDWSGHA